MTLLFKHLKQQDLMTPQPLRHYSGALACCKVTYMGYCRDRFQCTLELGTAFTKV